MTLGLAITRHFRRPCAPGYLIAQLAGRGSRSRRDLGPVRESGPRHRRLGATVPAARVSAGRDLAAEAVVTFALVLVVVAVVTDSRVPRCIDALAIGAVLAVAILTAGPISGAGVNPAWAIGPLIPAGQFTESWALAAPLADSAIAVALYDKVLAAGSTPT